MASVLYRPPDRIPAGLHPCAHGNGRLAALTHPGRARQGDVIVHGRGHCSFAMAVAHLERGPDLVFRVREGANPAFDRFTAPGGTDRTVTPGAPRDGTAPRGRTLRVRPVRYVAGDTECCLATSLTDGGRSGVRALSDLHHGRWGTGEMYGSGKSVTGRFQPNSVRGVRQEPCAAFVPLTPARRLSSRCDADVNGGAGGDLPGMRANLRNGPRPAGKGTGALSMGQADTVRQSAARIMTGPARRIQRGRPGRSHPREPERPGSRWIRRAAA